MKSQSMRCREEPVEAEVENDSVTLTWWNIGAEVVKKKEDKLSLTSPTLFSVMEFLEFCIETPLSLSCKV